MRTDRHALVFWIDIDVTSSIVPADAVERATEDLDLGPKHGTTHSL